PLLKKQNTRRPPKKKKGLPSTRSKSDFSTRLNKLCDISQQEAMAAALDRAAYYVERNANAKLLFMGLTLQLLYLLKFQTEVRVA
ncbi:MAG TPA: hypothetical protein PKE63_12255, partial [Lacibacter sp.]|nr:hypothetical protein [Lacibacter sp.]